MCYAEVFVKDLHERSSRKIFETRIASSKMAFRECDTGTRLQVLLERHSTPLIAELDNHVDFPRATVCRVRAVPKFFPDGTAWSTGSNWRKR
jgi:hypothetical protein